MAVFRVEKTKDYTIMANHHLKNKALSLKSKGLLSQMLSLPENWDYTLKGLSTINREKVDAIREAIKELEHFGYIVRTRSRNQQGQLKGSHYTIYEHPIHPPKLDSPILDNPTQVNPILENPALDNPTQLNTKESNTYALNNQNIYHPSNKEPPDGEGLEAFVLQLQSEIHERIGYTILLQRYSKERLDEIVAIMLETFCSKKPTLLISGDELPTCLVKERLRQIDHSHIEYILECLNKNTSYIHNIKKYLLTSIFNAPATIGSYYTALVNHDLKGSGLGR